MSVVISPSTSCAYGVERVCAAWEAPRSSFYARRGGEGTAATSEMPCKRGPKTAWSDAQLLDLIREDLEASPFQGEGHRKVWARLRVLKEVRVSRKRVLRIMREHNLLSPHRGRQRPAAAHVGEIVTTAPNVMWGTDGIRVFTVDEGWGWVFSAVEHWNAECLGWHVCKTGDRFAALEPIAMALERIFGGTGADIGRGLKLRMDHGTQYLSDHFTNQVRFWGITPSFAFVEQPQTNGVAERFNRTLQEQAIYGRVFHNLEEVRATVAEFVDRYNEHWRLEKLGFKTPLTARLEWVQEKAA